MRDQTSMDSHLEFYTKLPHLSPHVALHCQRRARLASWSGITKKNNSHVTAHDAWKEHSPGFYTNQYSRLSFRPHLDPHRPRARHRYQKKKSIKKNKNSIKKIKSESKNKYSLIGLFCCSPGLLRVLWQCGPLVLWSTGPLVPWSLGP